MDILTKFLNSISYKFPKGYPDLNNNDDVVLLNDILKETLNNPLINITEVNLSPTQLEKPFPSRSELSSKYKDRGEKFLEKIINGEELELNNGSSIIIDPKLSSNAIDLLKNKKYNNLGGTSKLFFDTQGNSFSLSNFKKTPELGSGTGQGAGTAATSLAESAQCVFTALAYKIKKGPISEEDVNPENLKKAFEYCDVTDSLESIISFSQDVSWRNTFINSSNIILQYFKNSNFEFHRGSKFVQSIYTAYKIASKSEGISMQSDKWNPADIWLVDKSILNFEFPQNLQELNAFLADMFSDNLLVGVSLKKLGKEGKLSISNISEESLKGHKLNNIVAPLSNKGAQWNYDDGKIYFRTFNFATNFAGEILGKTAAHGKIGAGPINDVLKYNKTEVIPNSKDIKSKFESNNEELLNDFYENYNIVVGELDKEKFLEFVSTKDMDWKVSKYMALHISSIAKQSPTLSNEILSDMIRYASSSTKSSSVFAKIS